MVLFSLEERNKDVQPSECSVLFHFPVCREADSNVERLIDD